MGEHDDDLESEVQEDAEEEIDRFPATGDDLEPDDSEAEDEEEALDEDETEL